MAGTQGRSNRGNDFGGNQSIRGRSPLSIAISKTNLGTRSNQVPQGVREGDIALRLSHRKYQLFVHTGRLTMMRNGTAIKQPQTNNI